MSERVMRAIRETDERRESANFVNCFMRVVKVDPFYRTRSW
jgi:hypothetical protein